MEIIAFFAGASIGALLIALLLRLWRIDSDIDRIEQLMEEAERRLAAERLRVVRGGQARGGATSAQVGRPPGRASMEPPSAA
jgi:nitrogen fixation-related uncharacterized protein